MLASFVRARVLRLVSRGSLAALCLLVPSAARASVDENVLAFCSANMAKFTQVIADSKISTADVPVPPELNPPCQECNGNSVAPTDSETAASAFVTYSEKPESDEIDYLLNIMRQTAQFANPQDVSAQATHCLNTFDNATITGAIGNLGHRLFYVKVLPMAKAYDKSTKRSYAGIKLLLAVARDRELLAGLTAAGDAGTAENAALSEATTWTQNVADDAEQNILAKNQYNLCPVYFQIVRTTALLGNDPNVDQLQQTLQKIEDKLHFDVTMDLHETSPSGSGGFDITWKLTSVLKVDIAHRESCFIPELTNNDLTVDVVNFSMHGADGTQVTLASPHHFTTPVAYVTLSLCDQNPQLALHFSSYGPLDVLAAKGGETNAGLFQSALSGAANSTVTNAFLGGSGSSGSSSDDSSSNSNSNNNNSAGGAAPSPSPKPTPSPRPTPNAALAAKMQALKAEIEAHKTDVSWLTGPQGQAAISQLQTDAMQQAATEAGPGGSSAIETAETKSNTLILTWTNGTATPVDQDVKFAYKGLNDTMHVTVKLAGK